MTFMALPFNAGELLSGDQADEPCPPQQLAAMCSLYGASDETREALATARLSRAAALSYLRTVSALRPELKNDADG